MAYNQIANQDFERAVLRGFWRKLLTRLTGANNELLPFDEVRDQLPVRGQHYLGSRQVPIDKIVGSMGRYHDFDRAFLPTQTRTKDRWISIDKAHHEQVNLPPVELFKIGEIYFVKDGNHRVSVARERGQVFVDAYVIEIDLPVVLTPETKVDDLALKRAYAEFMLETGLAQSRPVAQLETTVEGQYSRLMGHIAVHRWYLGEKRNHEVSFQEAAVSWYDTVYLPAIEIIRNQNVGKDFPGTSEADLYLWIMEYQGYLRQAYQIDGSHDAGAKTEAAKELVEDYPQPTVKKLVNLLNRTNWIDSLILTQERAEFLTQTGMADLRPDAQIRLTVLGQYTVLQEHIAVHRWYLGEHRQAEVPYAEAVISWFDQVYSPIVEMIRDQEIMRFFPGRTETDLYLWVIEHQQYLQETYGESVPLERAAEQFAEEVSQEGSTIRKRADQDQ